MKLMSLLTGIIIMVCFTLITGCTGGGSSGGDDPGSADGGSSSALEGVKSTSPLYITVESQYDGDDGEGTPTRYHGVCNIDPDNLANNDITCDITVPEGWLFFSNLTFTYGTGRADLCPRIEFYPYYRKLSDSATYTPRGATSDVDCTKPETVACYDGAALDIVPSFPENTGIWFPTDVVTSITATVNSAWSQESRTGNTHTCNNLPLADRGTDVTVSGVQVYESSFGFQDYELYCMDPHQGTVFHITMTIHDEDTDSSDTDAGNDQYYDWN